MSSPRSCRVSVLVAALLATPIVAQRLVTIESNVLQTIDLVTGARTPALALVGSLGTAAGLAYDATTNVLLRVSAATATLHAIDLATGVSVLVGPFGDPALVMHGCELDSSTGQLYGCSSHDGGFYAIDRTTGAATLLGLSGLGGITNLGYDSRSDTLYATNTFTDSLYVVDRATGAMTLVGPLQFSASPQGLAFDASTGVLYMVDHINDQLHAIDPATGTAHVVGSTGVGNLLGLAFVPGGTGGIVRQLHGCGNATIFAHGRPGLGGAVTVHLGDTTGVPFVGFGVVPMAVPFCGCTIGHEWSLAFAGATSNVAIPMGAGLLGFQVAMQGLDLFGAGGCADPALGLTDTLLLTIG